MSRPIRRLMLVSDGRSFGGAERYAMDMALAARRRGLEAHILWLPASGTARSVFECARQAGVAVTVNRGAVCWSGLVRGFRRSVARIRPDAVIINAAGRPRWWLTSWLAWGAGLPAAWVHHMVEQTDPRRLPPRRLGGRLEGPQSWRVPQALRHRLAAAAATAVVTSTDEDRDRVARWHSLNRSAICVIPPGVDCEKFRYDPAARTWVRKAWGISSGAEAPLVIGTAARLVRGKGIEPIIEATARLRARGGAVLAVIAGDGPDRDAFVELARRRGVGDAVRFAGFVREMPAFHSALDVFALCSETESFGLALTEAMACERAVVATPTTGARRQVRHLETGWQLQTFAAGELADALSALHADAGLRERLGRQARTRACEHFDIDRTLERTLQALLQPLARARFAAGEARVAGAASAGLG